MGPDDERAAREAASCRLKSLGALDSAHAGERSREGATSTRLRSVDDEPAALVYDSNLDTYLFAAVRAGAPAQRQLTFEAGGLALELEISGAGHLVGQVVPAQTALVELRHRGGTTPVETDDLGYFQLGSLPEGPVSFRYLPKGSAARAVATGWITF